MALMRVGHVSNDICSVQYIKGFNYTRTTDVAQSVGSLVRPMVDTNVSRYSNVDQTRSTGGVELLIGTEVNSKRDNTKSPPADHHGQSVHTGHIFKDVVETCGLGKVWLSAWSNGEGASGSQMRSITWTLPGRRQLAEKMAELRERLEAGTAPRYAKQVLHGFNMGGANW